MSKPITNIAEAIRIEIEGFGEADYTIPQLVDIIERKYPEAVAEATAKGRRQTITNHVKSQVAPPRSKQPMLPGFDGLPLRISLRVEGGFVYRSSLKATMDDFQAHLDLIDEGIAADQVARDQYVDGMERAGLVMRSHGVDRLIDVPPPADDDESGAA